VEKISKNKLDVVQKTGASSQKPHKPQILQFSKPQFIPAT